jgi:thioredoxin-related protein
LKKFTTIIFLLSLVSLFAVKDLAKNNSLEWKDNLEKAVDLAKTQKKAVLINFTGSDWCKWCKKLDAEVFSQNEFIKYADKNLILVKIDFPQYKEQEESIKSYNQQLAQMFRIQGFPTIILIDKNQKLAAYTGYQEGGAANYVKYLKSILK